MQLFHKYGLISHFNLDPTNLYKCFGKSGSTYKSPFKYFGSCGQTMQANEDSESCFGDYGVLRLIRRKIQY